MACPNVGRGSKFYCYSLFPINRPKYPCPHKCSGCDEASRDINERLKLTYRKPGSRQVSDAPQQHSQLRTYRHEPVTGIIAHWQASVPSPHRSLVTSDAEKRLFRSFTAW